MVLRRFAPAATDHLDPILGRHGGGARSAAVRRDGAPGHSLHGRATIPGTTVPGRSTLESIVGGGCRTRSADQLPYRLGQYGGWHAAREDGGLWADGYLHRALGQRLPA